jgi:glyoxylase-like metal-dependent hydrolase (beta-lactamase superfamily II)
VGGPGTSATDHAGGLRLFEDSGAEIIVHAEEYRTVENLTAPENFFNPVEFAVRKHNKPTLVYEETELTSGVRFVELPGHTPGTMGLLVELDHTGPVLLTSDALYTHQNYGPPATGSPISWDQPSWMHSVEEIRRLAVEHEALLFPGHDDTAIKQYKGGSQFRQIEFWESYQYE